MTGSVTAPVVVIGGGQAGLAVARCLQREGVEPVVLDAADRVGDAWRHRYDSLRLFTPAQYDALPDMAFPAPADTYPSKHDVADYLADYAERFGIDVRCGCRVDRLVWSAESSTFRLTAGDQQINASTVVVATGALQLPWRPTFAAGLTADVNQLHAADYRNPADVSGRRVLIVGAGNSGGQIAEELAADDDVVEVTISFGELPRRFPQRLLGRDIFWWFQRWGVMDRTRQDAGSSEAAVGAVPLIGSRLPKLVKSGQVRRAAPIVGADGAGLHAADGAVHRPDTVIWATGYRNDFTWIDIPNVLDEHGQPRHDRGISTTKANLAFIGLPGLHTKGSAFLGFVGRDAEHIATVIGDRQAATSSSA
ncbi:MAG: NAD(P)-binding domain-containing protein [Acidimicrobiales bacterium]|nr:NAD(P)-binding domain-containing protein [Acidimicrobiales bacterium]